MTVEPHQTALLGFYEALERASGEMLAAARAGDWARVARLEGAAGELIVRLRARLQDEPLDAEAARVRLRILRRIVLNDAELRCLSQPWLRDLHELLLGRTPSSDVDSTGSAGASGSPWSGRLH